MKLLITFSVFSALFSVWETREFSDEEISFFLPFIRRWVPPPCPMNEIYKYCKSKCSDCVQRGRCIETKCEEGCDCAPRFYRVAPDGPCEPVANCPRPECGENEIFRECGPICETCTLLECHVINCDHKCYCKEGYLRNKEGVCIPKEECHKRTHCSKTEEWAESGPEDEFCIPGADGDLSNKTQDIPGCYCLEGHKRNLLGRCVNETLCPIIRCFGNEVYHDCIPKCNTTCRNYGDPNCTEDDNCYPGCFCPPGFVMNDFRSCIEIGNCSLDIQQLKVIDAVEEEDDTDTTTLLPTCAATDQTTLDINSTTVDDTTELFMLNDTISKEMVTETTSNGNGNQTSESASPSTTPVTTTPVTTTTVTEGPVTTPPVTTTATTTTPVTTTSIPTTAAPKEKTKKEKLTRHKETRLENVAKAKENTKYEFIVEDEDGFDNDNL